MALDEFEIRIKRKSVLCIGYYPPTREVSYLLARAVNTIPPEAGG